MNSVAASLLSGAISAIGLNIIHETLRKTMPHPARVDIVGMRSVAKLARAAGTEPPEHLRSTALAGDIVSNSLYYSLTGVFGRQNALLTGACIGTAAGVGLLVLSPALGVGNAEVNRTTETQIAAAGMYFAAGIIAGAVYEVLADN